MIFFHILFNQKSIGDLTSLDIIILSPTDGSLELKR